MGPFQRAELPPHTFDVEWIMSTFRVSREIAQTQVDGMKGETIFMNDEYQVNVRVINVVGGWPCDMFWLSIKRLDKEAIHDWRVMQEIKNKVIGPGFEGLEIYPAESRLVDTANQYHMWVFTDAEIRLPFGFTDRAVGDENEAAEVNAKQRPFVK